MLVANHGYKRKIDNQSNKMKLYSSIKDRYHLLTLKPGYVMHPSPAQIYDRQFMIKDLKIRYNSTEVFWKGIVDLRYLKAPLAQIVDLGPTHIEVYPNQREKALAGKQLNKTCFVTFTKLPHLNKRKLTRVCEESDCQILALNQQKKQFTVQIHHFSKYSFNQVTQKQGETQQQKNNDDNNLIKEMKQKQYRAMQMQKQVKQKQRIASMKNIQVENNKLPTQEIQKQVAEQNMNNGHSIDQDRIKGSSMTYGVNSVVDSITISANKQCIIFENTLQKNRDNLYIVFNILKDANSINSYILSPNVKFQVKRVLVLYMILFHIENSKFDFQRDGQKKLKLVSKQGTVEVQYFLQYLKNWFEWVINEDPSLIGENNSLVTSLALRKTNQHAQNILQGNQPNRFVDSQFLSSIQDQHYRQQEASRALSLQLRQIATGNMQIFKNLPWIVKLGVFLWYYNFKPWPNISADKILDQPIKQCTHYNLERHILRTFAQKQFSKQNLTNISQLQNPLWWFISNVNTEKQKRLIQNIRQLQAKTNLLKNYDEYRFNILMELVQIYGDSNVTLQLISNQKYLKKEQITRILTAFIRKYPDEAERVPHSDWKQYSNLLHQNSAYRYYSSNRYIKALGQFALCTNLSKNSQHILKQIVSKQEIICGFHMKTIEKIKNILQKIKSQSIAIQVMFLNTILGQQQLKKNKVQSMIQLCYRIPQLKVRMRMLDQLFNAIIKSPNMIILLRKDIKFEYWLVSYYPDPTYQLELKFAKFRF